VAGAFGIQHWPVTAIKSYVGHSVASAAGDQLMACLGVWNDGILPGILTIDGVADDVEQAHLEYLLAHREMENTDMDAAIINSKGFGGNNASASIIAPHVVNTMLAKRHGKQALSEHRKRNEKIMEAAAEYDDATCRAKAARSIASITMCWAASRSRFPAPACK
jgi:acetoacetyl-[acyl-carrier protein] synthase